MPIAGRPEALAPRLRHGPLLALVPVLAALAFVLDGGLGVLAFALGFPAAVAASRALSAGPGDRGTARDGLTGLDLRPGVVAALDRALLGAARSGRGTAALAIEIDHVKLLEERHDHAAAERVLRVIGDRLAGALREDDVAGRLDGPTFAVALAPVRGLDLEATLQLAGRLHRTLSEPVALGGLDIHPTVCIGLSLPGRLRAPTGETLLQAAMLALIEAQRSGPAAIRSYSDAMRRRVDARGDLAAEVASALDRGEIRGFLQPQVSTRTGAITGFETLARWQHPARGLLPPAEFLPAVEQAGLMGRLGEAMLRAALTAMRGWEAEGIRIPSVGVNFSNAELCDPRLLDRIGWELDRFELAPDRLVVEVLETVVAARSEDVVIRNLAGLARLGCCLDLDDFGTGHASITSIRRFSIERIKIDRSFVTGIDQDPEQQRMVGAILTMAERLGLDTLAEGVETAAEQAMLASLGCGHVQGFGIARPMPYEETVAWVRAWEARATGGATRQLRAV